MCGPWLPNIDVAELATCGLVIVPHMPYVFLFSNEIDTHLWLFHDYSQNDIPPAAHPGFGKAELTTDHESRVKIGKQIWMVHINTQQEDRGDCTRRLLLWFLYLQRYVAVNVSLFSSNVKRRFTLLIYL